MTSLRKTGKRMSAQELASLTPHESAAYWFVREDAGDMSAEDKQELETWLAASDVHRRAYAQTGSMWKDFEGSADDSELRALRVAALSAAPRPKVWPRAAALAATLFGVAVLGALSWYWIGARHESSTAVATSAVPYTTGHGQRSTVTLSDGTVVSMNVDTSLTADLSNSERRIHLKKGQAFFEVAKDQVRPFIVAAGDRKIQALGTKFDVRLDRKQVDVVLLEGKVRVEQSDPSLLATLMQKDKPLELVPGQRLVAAVGKAPSVVRTNAAQASSWREGWVVFEDETVAQAITELNRYSDRPIVANDDAVRQMRLSGVFRIGQPDRFGSIIQELLPIEAEHGVNGETILVPRSKN